MEFCDSLELEFAKKYRYPIFMHPRWAPTSLWRDHIPFAFFLMAMIRPKKVVDLGTYLGTSFFSFCQAAKDFDIDSTLYAVDTWDGYEHSDKSNDDVYQYVKRAHIKYADISYLVRAEFDEAAKLDELNNIDILHIDGEPTYDAVKHDFETWLPKMSDKGVVLIHNTSVAQDGIDAWRAWPELSMKYPSGQLSHGSGLGILLVGSDVNEELIRFISDKDFNSYEEIFKAVGSSI